MSYFDNLQKECDDELAPETPEDEVRVEPLVSCPKCGGTSGFSFFATERQTWGGEWGDAGSIVRADSLKFTPAKTVACEDCGKKIKRKLLGI
jgi:DNA-directed RNA polymerase subunit RPC12/RpoP